MLWRNQKKLPTEMSWYVEWGKGWMGWVQEESLAAVQNPIPHIGSSGMVMADLCQQFH